VFVAEGARHGYFESRRLKLRPPVPRKENAEDEVEKAEIIKNQAAQVLFDGTQERCSSSVEKLPEDVQMLCKQTRPESLLDVMLEKLQNSSQDVALWLCSAAEGTIDKEWSTRYSERLSCDEAATSTIGAMLDLDNQATLAGRLYAAARFMLWTSKFALVVATPFIPLPFGFLARKFLDVVIGQLTGEAEEELSTLEKRMEKKMEEVSRRTAQKLQLEEAFRIGSAHARAANDQIKDMAMIDHLWSSSMTAMSESGARKENALLWSTMKKVTSFNRWAIIEHDLAMCIEVLTPSDSLELADRASFTKLMKVHFEMYVLVLSHMSAAAASNENVEEMNAELSKKAARMASITLPQLVLLSTAVEPGQDLKAVQRMFDSDLLSPNATEAEVQGCDFLQAEVDYEFEFLAACVWLPFLTTDEVWAVPLPTPKLLTARGQDTDRPDPNAFEFWHATGAKLQSADPPTIEMGHTELEISCPPGKFLTSVEYEYKKPTSGWTVGKQHFLTGLCSTDDNVETAGNSQFTTAGMCTDAVTLFADHTVAVMISLSFSRNADSAAKIHRSTCQLAYRWSAEGPYHIPGNSSQTRHEIFCERDCSAKSLMARGDYAYVVRSGHGPKAAKEEIDVWKWSDKFSRLQWMRSIQLPEICTSSSCRNKISAVTVARNYMVFGLSDGKIAWTSMEFDYHFLPFLSVGELGAKKMPISSLVARGGYLFAASDKAMLVYMISMMPRTIELTKKFQVLPEITMKETKSKTAMKSQPGEVAVAIGSGSGSGFAADAGEQEGVRALTVVDGHMYIASRRHIHRIAIATQEAAFVYHDQGLTPSIAGVRDGFLYVRWSSSYVTDSERSKEELTKLPLHFQGPGDVSHVMPLATARTVSNSPVAVSSEHAYEVTKIGLAELDLRKGLKGQEVRLCQTCYVKSIALWRGRVYQTYARIGGLSPMDRPIHPAVQKFMEERGIKNPLAPS